LPRRCSRARSILVIPQIAVDLAIDAKTAALLSTAYTFPYALIQPLLGALSDTIGQNPRHERGAPDRRNQRR
jgi:MFS family permease